MKNKLITGTVLLAAIFCTTGANPIDSSATVAAPTSIAFDMKQPVSNAKETITATGTYNVSPNERFGSISFYGFNTTLKQGNSVAATAANQNWAATLKVVAGPYSCSATLTTFDAAGKAIVTNTPMPNAAVTVN